jgi:hypothetical protein
LILTSPAEFSNYLSSPVLTFGLKNVDPSRNERPVGYGYLGVRNGPFTLLDETDFPAVLAHAESQALRQGRKEFGLEVPMIIQVAVDYLLGRGFRLDSFMAVMMTDRPFARFENYILTSPPFFL